ncbi:portal protein [Rhodobacter phage RcCWillis]|nr:portal protein [Rhodobacter phage RcCWillis]
MGMMNTDTDLSDLLGVAGVSGATTSEVTPSDAMAVAAAASGGVSHDAASVVDQLANWTPAIRSADAEILPEKGRLDARARDTLRNDAYVAGGATLHKDNIVGARYLLNARPMTKIIFGKEDPVWETDFQEEVETLFTLWAESPLNWCDAQRVNTLTDMVRLAVGSHTATGEVLASAEWMPDDGRPFRTAAMMIDTDRLSTPTVTSALFKNNIRNGVERDRRGAPIAYHIRNTHPNEGSFSLFEMGKSLSWRRVPARKPWGRPLILHIFEQNRPDQSRGISAMTAALGEMRMTKHFRKTELQRAVIAATYAASIESDLPADAVLQMGGGDGDSATTAWIEDYLGWVNDYQSSANRLHLGGAQIPVFVPGTHLKIQNPGAASPAGDKFEASLLRHIATALNVSYEELSRDFTNTNYSSARAAMMLTWKAMQSRKKKVADTTASFVYRLWLEECVNYNLLETLKGRTVPAFYDGMNAEAYSHCDWIGAGRGQIDPLKETQASILKIKAGLSTKEAEIAQLSGGDWRRNARQIQRELELDRKLNIPSIYDQTDTQDQQNALSGTKREPKEGQADGE